MIAKFAKPLIAAAGLTALLGCSDTSSNLDDAAAALSEYYAANPFKRDWHVSTIAKLTKENKLVARVEINAEGDVQRLRSLSSMEQFSVAKLACPNMTTDLRESLGDVRVWVALTTEDKQITTSICPK